MDRRTWAEIGRGMRIERRSDGPRCKIRKIKGENERR